MQAVSAAYYPILMGETIPHPHNRFANQTALSTAVTPREDGAQVGGRNDIPKGHVGRLTNCHGVRTAYGGVAGTV